MIRLFTGTAAFLLLVLLLHSVLCTSQKEHESFFNRGQKTDSKSKEKLQEGNQVEKSKVDLLGSVLKRHVEALRQTQNKQVELIFLVDSSASVGAENFFNELKFVKKLLADFTVEYNATRVAVITFSSRNRVVKHVDHVSEPSALNHKCSLLEEQLPTITYQGGGTYTLGAVLQAQEVLEKARPNAAKAVFLVTDGYSNGGDPRPAAKVLRDQNVEIFTFGIQNGNVKELYDMASPPAEEHSYILDSFEEFEALARRALHEDLQIGTYLKQETNSCSKLCIETEDCCDAKSFCTCGTHTGHYACLCEEGFYGTGVNGDCQPCPPGTYKPTSSPGDESSCIPCPDVNHISYPASIKMEQCLCKTGFLKENDKCVALSCPVLTPPENGYFVNEDCTNVFNAACGIRCNAGFKLKGSSIRICAENGTWTGETASCQMKTCPALSPPRLGFMNCTSHNNVFETECLFSCEPGMYLVGSKKRTCLAISLWDGLPALCRPVNCQAMDLLPNGKISPSKCTKGKSSYGEKCTYECNEGFQLTGPEHSECGDSGTWLNRETMTECLDVEPPLIKCPEDIVLDAEENEASALVRWSEPITADNSEDPVVVTVVPAIVPPRRFDIGIATVVYSAHDRAGNKASCVFIVTVRDVQPPTVDRCISPPIVFSRIVPVEIHWDEPMFSDNSGKTLSVVSSHQNPSILSLGTTKVIYEVKDEAGNENNCTITVTVQEHACAFPVDPVHGSVNCTEAEKGVYCSLTCNDGYGFALKTPQFYFCAYDGIWEPVEYLPFPDCSIMFLSNSISKIGTVSVSFNGMSCRDNFLLAQLEKHLERKISNRISRICRNKIICEIENMIADCDYGRDKAEEETNKIYRRKRQISNRVNESHPDFEPPTRMDKTDADYLDDGQYPISHSDPLSTDQENKIELEFQLTGKLPENSEEREEQNSLLDSMTVAMASLEDAASRGELDLSLGNNQLRVQYVRFNGGKPHFVCAQGTIAQDNICVKCPVGTFFNVISENCEACPMGTYQFMEGQFSCVVCPDRTSTTTGQSKSLGECKAQCLPGTFSTNGLEPCETCPIGFYQPLYAQEFCLPCPVPKTTHRRGVRNVLECKAPCRPGKVSRIGLQPCFPCPDGFFQPHEGAKACFKCPEDLRTGIQGASDISSCHGISKESILSRVMPKAEELTINDCFSVPCHHGATCRALDIGFLCICAPGYTGIYCEKEIDECENDPCKNGGTCKDHVNAYTCFCSLGYSGKHCEEDINDCLHEPCFNDATCFDQINGYSCRCSPGFAGPLCQYNVDECISNPCRNGGFCMDLIANYTCDCMPGFEGHNCEINIDDCVTKPCKNNATCKDDILHYRCDCLPGFKGEQCEIDIDECRPEPCMNAATCVDRTAGFKCVCPPSFTGDLCETELPSNFLLHFPSSGISDFVQLDTLPRQLTATTICMWLLTKDTINYGTPFSYATDDSGDNLLTLTDYSGFVFYVNMQKVVTDVTANDGEWHHICVTWSSGTGAWSLYKDGQQEDSGANLAIGTVIPARGLIVLGQEQDRRGAGFSAPESFIGTLTLLNIWDYVLESSIISSFSSRCDNYRGNVRSWADFKSGIRGKVQYVESHFCSGCNTPESFTDGEIIVSGVKTQSVVSYVCNTGFELRGVTSRRCLVSGEWSDVTPKCSRMTCGYPGSIANGYINGRQYTYESVIRYVCNPGYRLNGDSSRNCQADSNWSGSIPNCEEIVCLPPNPIENVEIIGTQRYYQLGHRIQFACDDGYRLDGPGSLTCTSSGQWNDSLPICQPKSCESPPRVPHGQIIGSPRNLHVGSVVRYKCDEGFEMKQSGEMHCELKNRWAGDLPRCERKSCPSPTDILQGTFEGSDQKFGGMVTYKCDRGYDLTGSSSSACQADGTWSHPPPECLPIRCKPLQSPDQGRVDTDDTTYGSVAKYSCYTGYELQGVRSRKCRATGDWSGESPTCVPVSCSQPESIANGRYTGSDWTVGNTATYSCNPGYVLVGESDRVCLDSGQWLHLAPSCAPIECPTPQTITYGTVRFDGRRFGQRVTYSCDVGHRLVGAMDRVCMEDQKWGPEEPECHPVSCGPPPQGENVVMISTSHVYKGTAKYSCSEGFRLDGPDIRTCLANGQWSGKDPICDVIRCPEPLQVTHAYLINSDTRFGSVVEYFCDEGYKLRGHIQRICGSNGYWQGDEPQCVRVRCPYPPPLSNGDVTAGNTFYKSMATYTCHRGYELKGNSQRNCLQDESWNGSDPECIAIRCSKELLFITHGRIIGQSDMVGGTIQYECDVGYILIGELTRTCKDDKSWSGQTPLCNKVQCTIPLPPTHGTAKWNGHSFEDIVTYSCSEGYVVQGEGFRSCLPDGTWSGTETRCRPVECPLLSNPKHGLVTLVANTYRSVAEYKCNSGYKMRGSGKRTCSSDRRWSEKEPKCQMITCSPPPDLLFGFVRNTTDIYAVNITIEYTCKEGFRLVATKTPIVCDSQGKWHGQLPACKIVECPQPPALKFGYVDGTNFTFGNSVHFICNIGWKLIGEVTLNCNSNGQWSGPYPTCIGTLCPTPTHVENGFVSSNNYSFGAVIKYHCAKGYDIIGTAEQICQNDNTWSGSSPKCQPVVCGPPLNITHSTIVGKIYEFGNTVTYICNRGYVLHGIKQLSCTEHGTWSSKPPVCELISCPLPDPLANGEIVVHSFRQGGTGRDVEPWQLGLPRGDITVDGKDILETSRSDVFHLNDQVTYKCAAGYKLIGVSGRSCQENGSWSNEGPKCAPVKCNNPENLMMGDVAVTTLVYKSRVNYSCGLGFKISGPKFRECQANATWSSGRPTCSPIECPFVQNIPHGHVKWTSVHYGASVTYECAPGYKMTGTSMRLCEQSGSWSKSEPTCIAKECEAPESPENGWVEADNIIVGSLATYFCNDGFELQGSSIRTCLKNESWSLYIPICKRIACMPPDSIIHGYYNASIYLFESTVEYSCDEGYQLEGSAILKCLSSKIWSRSAPVCEPRPCPRPVSPSHGTVLFRTLVVGSTVYFSCKDGYKIKGATNSTCLPSQTWDVNPPSCEIITCQMPNPPKHGKIIGSNITYENILTFQCHPKYKLEGADLISCTAHGNWSKSVLKCLRYLCDDPPKSTNATFSPGPYIVGSELHYNCIKGYVIKGKQSIFCDQNGHWQGVMPQCNPVNCSIPPAVANSKVLLSGGYTLGAIGKYICREGYKLVGEAITCGPEGNWTAAPPYCEEIHCVDPPPIAHAEFLLHKKPGVTEVKYTCDTGYKLMGSEKHVCIGNNTWNIQKISCEIIKCSVPPSISHGTTTGSYNVSYGSIITYHCFPGYRMVGEAELHCTQLGIWGGKPPHCTPVSCPVPNAPQHGTVDGSNFVFQNAILYECNKGYQIFGRDTRFCLEDGTWSGQEPHCRKISCGEITTPDNGYVVSEKNLRFEDNIVFACHRGFKLFGEAAIQCTGSGQWSQSPPTCEAITCDPPTSYPQSVFPVDYGNRTFVVDDKLNYHCELGYRQHGELSIQCLPNSSWTEVVGSCKKISCGRPKMNNGAVVLGMSYLYRDNLVVVCPPGTKTKGKTILNCKSNGEWDAKPTCQGMCPKPCRNGGVCIPPGLCSCTSGYVGDVCQHAVCILPCLNGGTCIGPYNCFCPPGFTGTRCQTALSKRRGRLYRG